MKKHNISVSSGIKASFVYVVANIISRSLAIITLPIFTRIMSTEDIGVVNIYNSWFSLLTEIIGLALVSGGLNKCLSYFAEERDAYLSSVCFLSMLTGGLTTIVYFICPNMWNELLNMDTSMCIMLLIGLMILPAQSFWLTKQRYEYNYKMVGIVSITEAILASVLSVFLVVYGKRIGKPNLGELRLVGNNLIQFLFSGVMLVSLFTKGRTFLSKKYWSYSLSISIPLIAHQIASQVLGVSDRIMIGKLVGNSEAGIYGTIYTLSSITTIVWMGMSAAYVPYLYENIEGNKKNEIGKITVALLVAYLVVIIGIMLCAPEILRLLTTREYANNASLVPPIAIAMFFIAVSNIYSNILIFYKKTNYIFIATVVAAIMNVCMNWFGIRIFDYKVAAYTTLLSYIVMVFIEGRIAKSVYEKETGEVFLYDVRILRLLELLSVISFIIVLILYNHVLVKYSVIILLLMVIIYRRKDIIKLLYSTGFIKKNN